MEFSLRLFTLADERRPVTRGKSLIDSGINIFIRPIATFPLNYILRLDRRVEASDKSRQITHGSPTSCFSFIHSRLVVIDLIATA